MQILSVISDILSTDFELQAGLVELIFRLIPADVRQKKAQEYFAISSVAEAFSDITSQEFEAVSSNLRRSKNTFLPL